MARWQLARICTRAGIVAEVGIPALRRVRGVLLLASGCPSVPCAKELLAFLASEGWWGVHLRYRGSWESKGAFLSREPTDDVREVLEALKQRIVDIWSGAEVAVPPHLPRFVVGASFGGPAALFASAFPAVEKVVALSPVVDWKALNRGEESMAEWQRRLREGFAGAYRVPHSRHLRALCGNRWYTPVAQPHRIVASKALILHARDDTVVPPEEVVQFAQAHGISLALYRRGGHLGLSDLARRRILWRRVVRFLTEKKRP